jgi:hypothetical protein
LEISSGGEKLSYAEFKAPGGLIKVELECEGDKILHVLLSGDFFMYPENALERLEQILIGVKVDEKSLLRKVQQFYDSTNVQTPMVGPVHWVEAILHAVGG